MADFFDGLNEAHTGFIARQPVFFVATAAPDARINLSPKGMDSFRVVEPRRVAWLDVYGSGNETNAHLAADGRITVMFCAFDNPALILRLYGRARAVLPQDADWGALAEGFTLLPGTRQIFDMTVESVQTSCGWGVPMMTLDQPRTTLSRYHAKDSDADRIARWSTRTASIDGLPVRVPTIPPPQQAG